jgi:hypothetical protein
MHMAHTSAAILEARRAVLTVATALVASTIASAAVITGMMAVIDGGAATSKKLFQLLDGGHPERVRQARANQESSACEIR